MKKFETWKLICKKASQYAKEYTQQKRELYQLKREARFKGGFYVNPEAKLLFNIRIRGINAMYPTTKKILQLLRLRQISNLQQLTRFTELCLVLLLDTPTLKVSES